MLHAMIMAGGGGTRFWPRSRQQAAQAVPDAGRRPLALAAWRWTASRRWCRRNAPGSSPARRTAPRPAQQLPSLPADHIVGEPCGRDTAPCIGLGAALIAARRSRRRHAGRRRPTTSSSRCRSSAGPCRSPRRWPRNIRPPWSPSASRRRFPSTGYGYIHRGAEVGRRKGVGVYRVRGFREKPDADLAEQLPRLRRVLLEQRHLRLEGRDGAGRSCANSGRCSTPPCSASPTPGQRRTDPPCCDPNTRRWRRSASTTPSWSTPRRCWWCRRRTAGTTSAAGWPWSGCTRRTPTATRCWPTHCGINTNDCVIVGDAGQLIATIGVSNLLIVQDGDATLVADRREEGTVKQLVELLQKKGLEKYL